MTRKSPARRSSRKTPISPRAVLLAGLGAASLCRKQALKSVDGLAEATQALRKRADATARDAGKRAASLRKQAEARLAPVQKQASRLAAQAQAEFETRFGPLLVQLGAEPVRARRTTRPAKRTARPAAKRARKRA
ncbi:hypothetical protein [Arenimonas sp. MALMAid1274]|uniref:hypothetical protein n=1 Tax=Arenimonas sp. MALMAid1274 TaxID=3411630 RepID=UPI003B9E5225